MKLPEFRIWTTLACIVCAVSIRSDIVLGQDKVSLGCFGSAGACLDHSLTCPNTSRVAIEKALYGHKQELRCTPGVTICSDPCCSYLPESDCFHTFQADDVSDIYRNCTVHSCLFRTPRLVQDCTQSLDRFQAVSSYSVVEYECIDEATIIPMCGEIFSVSGRSVSILYDPRKQYMTSGDTCWCSMRQTTSNLVSIEGIDLRLKSHSGCGVVDIFDPSAFKQRDCNSPLLWPTLTMMETYGQYTMVKLTGLAEFVWIRFRATDVVHVICSLNARHTTTTPTTSASTTMSTAITTYTTLTYPTASLPDSRTEASSASSRSTDTVSSSSSSVSTTGTIPATYQSSSSSVGTTRRDASPGPTLGVSGDDRVPAAVGGAVGGLLLLVVIVCCVVWCRRKQRHTKSVVGKESPIYTDPASQSATNPAFSNPIYNNVKISTDKHVTPSPSVKIPIDTPLVKPAVTIPNDTPSETKGPNDMPTATSTMKVPSKHTVTSGSSVKIPIDKPLVKPAAMVPSDASRENILNLVPPTAEGSDKESVATSTAKVTDTKPGIPPVGGSSSNMLKPAVTTIQIKSDTPTATATGRVQSNPPIVTVVTVPSNKPGAVPAVKDAKVITSPSEAAESTVAQMTRL